MCLSENRACNCAQLSLFLPRPPALAHVYLVSSSESSESAVSSESSESSEFAAVHLTVAAFCAMCYVCL